MFSTKAPYAPKKLSKPNLFKNAIARLERISCSRILFEPNEMLTYLVLEKLEGSKIALIYTSSPL